MFRRPFSVLIGFLVMLSAGLLHCSDSPTSPTSNPYNLSPAEKELIQSDNRFGIKLFQAINEAEGTKNLFISPLSVAMALGMTYNGADGETQEAMAQTLELSGLTPEQINESYRHLIDLLLGLDATVELGIANSIWYRQPGFPSPETDFLDRCQQYFDALVAGLDFNSSDAAATINAWVQEHTNDRIDKIVDGPIDPYAVMFLINAIYFKGSWTYRFDEDLTEDGYFYRPDGSTILCQMMSQRGQFRHFDHQDYRILDLPYGDGAFRMTIFVPRPGGDLDSLLSLIDAQSFDSQQMSYWLGFLQADSLDIYLPKFSLEYELDLKEVLSALGMEIAFTPGADFTRMFAGGGVWIDQVRHKTFVEVNEEGTEAAAVTSVVMVNSADDSQFFYVDRPFAFIIREAESGTILFIGKIVDPTAG
jgi:serine protease inhibitor